MKKSSYDWLKEHQYKNLTILDPDGFDRQNLESSMSELITKREFNRRVSYSTISWPLADMLAADKEEIGLVEFTD